MKRNMLIFAFLLLTAAVITGCGKSEESEDMHEGMANRNIDSTLIRDANVDVATLDLNGDDIVFQCPMDWHVISDSPGSCPICKMDLEQFSVADAQKNLEENPPHNH